MAEKRIIIDLDNCIRSGQCFYMHPGLLRARADGYPEPVSAAPLRAADMEEARTLLDVCPVGAISIAGSE